MSDMLRKKYAVVFGAGGTIGAAVAKEFATEGAEVFHSGRTKSKVEEVAKQITAAGGRAHASVIDALDEGAVNNYMDGIVKQAGRIDVVFNAIGPLVKEYGGGKRAVDLTIEEVMVPLTTILKSNFITAHAAVRHMIKQRSGVIIFLTGSTVRGHVEGGTSIGVTFGAIETLMENLAFGIGPSGVRAVCIRTTANTDSGAIQQVMESMAGQMKITKEQAVAHIASYNFLKIPASIADTAKLAAFLASDRARLMTGTVVNSSAGAALD
jgi:NAD(P)-dependent dehydrogenase (short-subunit alcohol dehydrogenase family)